VKRFVSKHHWTNSVVFGAVEAAANAENEKEKKGTAKVKVERASSSASADPSSTAEECLSCGKDMGGGEAIVACSKC
jgi:hypothetical protein